ncbi:MAG: SGNH/GDSL hydrolase family protein [Ruminococcaceae bacterium]|nr:SGNH/GDSL hydrolase family protein [Oscillospiraceae bacterium]
MCEQWSGKKWYCYGTSMTDNRGDIKSGYYSGFLAEMAGLEEHNFGKGGSGVVPSIHGQDSIKSRVMTLEDGKAEADLITVEIIPNDMAAPLGAVTDWEDDTFCGNVNQMLAYLQENTKAAIAVLIATRSRYNYQNKEEQYTPNSEFVQERLVWEEAVETICRMHGIPCWNGAAEGGLGYYRMGKDNEYVQDQIHLTAKGGKVLAQYYWGKLQNLYPVK